MPVDPILAALDAAERRPPTPPPDPILAALNAAETRTPFNAPRVATPPPAAAVLPGPPRSIVPMKAAGYSGPATVTPAPRPIDQVVVGSEIPVASAPGPDVSGVGQILRGGRDLVRAIVTPPPASSAPSGPDARVVAGSEIPVAALGGVGDRANAMLAAGHDIMSGGFKALTPVMVGAAITNPAAAVTVLSAAMLEGAYTKAALQEIGASEPLANFASDIAAIVAGGAASEFAGAVGSVRQQKATAQDADAAARTAAARVLGINPKADAETAKAAYYAKAKESHPDVNPNADPAAMANINAAYQWMKDHPTEPAATTSLKSWLNDQVTWLRKIVKPEPKAAAPSVGARTLTAPVEAPPKPNDVLAAPPAEVAPPPAVARPVAPVAADPILAALDAAERTPAAVVPPAPVAAPSSPTVAPAAPVETAGTSEDVEASARAALATIRQHGFDVEEYDDTRKRWIATKHGVTDTTRGYGGGESPKKGSTVVLDALAVFNRLSEDDGARLINEPVRDLTSIAREELAARAAERPPVTVPDNPVAQRLEAERREIERRVQAGESPTGEERRVEPEPRKFSSTQVNLPDALAQQVIAKANAIPDADLAPDGRAGATPDTAPHVTVKFGLHTTDAEEVRALLADEPPITVTLGTTSIFPNGESGSGDVVKVDVDSPDLHRLNKKIADALDVTDTFPTYRPHVTIAHVLKGLGKKYAGDESFLGQTVTLDSIRFSGKDGQQVDIPLAGAPKAQSPEPVAAKLQEPPTLEWRGPANKSPEFAKALADAESLGSRVQQAYADMRSAQAEREKRGYGTKARDAATRKATALQEAYNALEPQAEKARQDAYDLRLQEALADTDTPPEARLALADAVQHRRKQQKGGASYPVLVEEAQRQLKALGATKDEAETHAISVASTLSTSPLATNHWFAKAIPNEWRLIEEQRARVKGEKQLKALEKKYGIQSTRATRRVESAVTEEERAAALAEAEADFKESRAKSEAEQRAKDEKTREAKDANLVQAAEWDKAGKLVWRRIGDEGWEAVEGAKAKIPSAPRDVQFSVFKDPRSGKWAVVENSTGLAVGFGTSRKAALDAATAKVGEAGVQKFKGIIAKALTSTPEKPSLATGGGSSSGDASTTVFTETAPVRPGRRPPSAAADVIRPIEVPELVELAMRLQGVPGVVKGFSGKPKYGLFRGREGIQVLADLFKKGNETQLASTLAHEIGHLVDWLPHQTMKRGNLLGRLQSLLSFMKHSFTAPDGTTIKLKTVRAELVALSAKWRPWDREKAEAKDIRYRDSSRELYADALSVLLNNPGMLEAEAPTFYRQFFDLLDRKPDVREAYFALQEVLAGTPEELVARRIAGDLRMMREGDSKAIDVERQRRLTEEARKKDILVSLGIDLIDKNWAVLQKIDDMRARGIVLPQDLDPRYMLQEREHIGALQKAFVERHFAPLLVEANEHDIPWEYVGLATLYERVISGDRGEFANQGGLSNHLDDASRRYAAIKRELGGDRAAVLERIVTKLRKPFADLMTRAHREGYYDDDTAKMMDANPAYAPFRVIEHMDGHMSSRVYQQVGSLKAVANPANSLILKAMVTLRALEHNKVTRAVVETIDSAHPGDAPAAKMGWNGKRRVPLESKDPHRELVTYYKAGHLVGAYVDPYIAASINRETVGQNNAIIRMFRAVNSGMFRPLFVVYNPGFWGTNGAKDFLRYWKTMPSTAIAKALRGYLHAVPIAKLRAFGVPTGRPMTPTERQAYLDMLDSEEARMLPVAYSDYVAHENDESEIESIFSRSGVEGFGAEVKPWRRHPVKATLSAMRSVGDFIEALPKAAAILQFKEQYGSIVAIPPAVRSFIRQNIGSPDFRQGGRLKPITNEILLFSNPVTQGWRSDLGLMRETWRRRQALLGGSGGSGAGAGTGSAGPGGAEYEPRTASGWWWKTIAVNLLPKALAYMSVMGLFGAALKRMMEKVTAYDATNYIVVPLPQWRDGEWRGTDERGNVLYLRVPQDDTGRVIGGAFHKLMHILDRKDTLDSLSDIFDYSAGQFPSIAPGIQVGAATATAIGGGNPRDWFRGRNVFTDDEQRARDRHTLKTFVEWVFQTAGGGIVWKFYAGEARPMVKTRTQRVLDLPVVSNIIGRFVKVTNFGETEGLRAAQQGAQRDEARGRLSEREAIGQAIRDMQAPGTYATGAPTPDRTQAVTRAAVKIAAELYRDDRVEGIRRLPEIRKALQLGVIRSEGDPLVNAMLSAGSNKQKLAILQEAVRRGAIGEPEAAGAK